MSRGYDCVFTHATYELYCGKKVVLIAKTLSYTRDYVQQCPLTIMNFMSTKSALGEPNVLWNWLFQFSSDHMFIYSFVHVFCKQDKLTSKCITQMETMAKVIERR